MAEPLLLNQIFEEFLQHCKAQKLHIWADPNLKRDKGTTGHWNGDDHISVFRPDIPQVTGITPNSSDKTIKSFVESSPNIQFELNTLLHEYGHWHHKHPTNVDSQALYNQEVEAWEKAEEIGATLGITDLTEFRKQKEDALEGYRIGLGIGSQQTFSTDDN
jgi:hypothetical protein